MIRRKDAERCFAEPLRAQTVEPMVCTDYTRLQARRRDRRGRSGLAWGLVLWTAAGAVGLFAKAVG